MKLYTYVGTSKLKVAELVEKRGPCNALNLYIGPAWHDIQTNIGLPPGKCPVRKVLMKYLLNCIKKIIGF